MPPASLLVTICYQLRDKTKSVSTGLFQRDIFWSTSMALAHFRSGKEHTLPALSKAHQIWRITLSINSILDLGTTSWWVSSVLQMRVGQRTKYLRVCNRKVKSSLYTCLQQLGDRKRLSGQQPELQQKPPSCTNRIIQQRHSANEHKEKIQRK